MRGNDAGSAPRADISASASVFRGFGAGSAVGRLPAGRFPGKRRSGGAESSVLVQRFAVLPRPLALVPHPFAVLPHSLAFAFAQDLADPVEVGGEDGEADRPLEPVRAAQPDPVQTAVLK